MNKLEAKLMHRQCRSYGATQRLYDNPTGRYIGYVSVKHGFCKPLIGLANIRRAIRSQIGTIRTIAERKVTIEALKGF